VILGSVWWCETTLHFGQETWCASGAVKACLSDGVDALASTCSMYLTGSSMCFDDDVSHGYSLSGRLAELRTKVVMTSSCGLFVEREFGEAVLLL
jgi:hypothetical protein